MPRVVAIIRFSLVTDENRGFALTKDLSVEARARVVFAPKRMEARFELFERFCLPSLIAQPAGEFAAVLLTSDLMPARYRERLMGLLKGHPNLKARFERPGGIHPLALRALGSATEDLPDDAVLLSCRLDDDDALADDYTEQVLGHLHPATVGYCLSFPLGLHVAKLRGEYRFWESNIPFVSAGLGFITYRSTDKTAYHCGHQLKVWRSFPSIVDGRRPGYLMSLHEHNDSTLSVRRTWIDRILRRRRHRNEQRNPPPSTLSLNEAMTKYPNLASSLMTLSRAGQR